jgi:hypothetical protein
MKILLVEDEFILADDLSSHAIYLRAVVGHFQKSLKTSLLGKKKIR